MRLFLSTFLITITFLFSWVGNSQVIGQEKSLGPKKGEDFDSMPPATPVRATRTPSGPKPNPASSPAGRAAQSAAQGLSEVQAFGSAANSCGVESLFLLQPQAAEPFSEKQDRGCSDLVSRACNERYADKKTADLREYLSLKTCAAAPREKTQQQKLKLALDLYLKDIEEGAKESNKKFWSSLEEPLTSQLNECLLKGEFDINKQFENEFGKSRRELAQNVLKTMKKSSKFFLTSWKSSMLQDVSGKEKKFVEGVFSQMESSIDSVELGVGSEENCIYSQKNAFIARSSGKVIVNLCPAILLQGQDAIAGALSVALGRAMDSCSFDYKSVDGLSLQALLEPIRECVGKKSNSQTMPALSVTDLIKQDSKKVGSFATSNGLHCPSQMTASTKSNAKFDQSNDALSKYWGVLFLTSFYKDREKGSLKLELPMHVYCEDGATKKGPFASARDVLKVALRSPETADESACAAQSEMEAKNRKILWNGHLTNPKFDSTFNPAKTNSLSCDGMLAKGIAQYFPHLEEKVEPFPVKNLSPNPKLAKATSVEKAAPERRVLSSDFYLNLSTQLEENTKVCRASYDAGNTTKEPAFVNLFNSACKDKTGYIKMIMPMAKSVHELNLGDGSKAYSGCISMCLCSERECHYPEAEIIADIDRPRETVTENIEKDVEFILDENKDAHRYSTASKACFTANPLFAVGTKWHQISCSKGSSSISSKNVQKELSASVLGELSGAELQFGCQINCTCGNSAICKAQIGEVKAKQITDKAKFLNDVQPFGAAAVLKKLNKNKPTSTDAEPTGEEKEIEGLSPASENEPRSKVGGSATTPPKKGEVVLAPNKTGSALSAPKPKTLETKSEATQKAVAPVPKPVAPNTRPKTTATSYSVNGFALESPKVVLTEDVQESFFDALSRERDPQKVFRGFKGKTLRDQAMLFDFERYFANNLDLACEQIFYKKFPKEQVNAAVSKLKKITMTDVFFSDDAGPLLKTNIPYTCEMKPFDCTAEKQCAEKCFCPSVKAKPLALTNADLSYRELYEKSGVAKQSTQAIKEISDDTYRLDLATLTKDFNTLQETDNIEETPTLDSESKKIAEENVKTAGSMFACDTNLNNQLPVKKQTVKSSSGFIYEIKTIPDYDCKKSPPKPKLTLRKLVSGPFTEDHACPVYEALLEPRDSLGGQFAIDNMTYLPVFGDALKDPTGKTKYQTARRLNRGGKESVCAYECSADIGMCHLINAK